MNCVSDIQSRDRLLLKWNFFFCTIKTSQKDEDEQYKNIIIRVSASKKGTVLSLFFQYIPLVLPNLINMEKDMVAPGEGRDPKIHNPLRRTSRDVGTSQNTPTKCTRAQRNNTVTLTENEYVSPH